MLKVQEEDSVRLAPKYKIKSTLNETVFGISLVAIVLVASVVIPTWIIVEFFRIVGVSL